MHFAQCRYAQNGTYTLKDSPHPQRSVSLGLLNTKDDENSSSLKSIVVPNKYITAPGSINTLTPFSPNPFFAVKLPFF